MLSGYRRNFVDQKFEKRAIRGPFVILNIYLLRRCYLEENIST
jgi:hypothetical protein